MSAIKESPQENPRNQYAALPFKDDGELEVMLVSSRETRRWILPKGWPMKGRKPHGTAAREALEEAGIVGKIGKEPVGTYHYMKRRKNGSSTLCLVTVYPMRVQRQRKSWPEKEQRTTRWFPVDEAADLVTEPELSEVIRNFGKLALENPDALPKLGLPPPLAIDGSGRP